MERGGGDVILLQILTRPNVHTPIDLPRVGGEDLRRLTLADKFSSKSYRQRCLTAGGRSEYGNEFIQQLT